MPFGLRKVTTRVAGSQPVMVTVVMRCEATNPPGLPGAGVTLPASARSIAGSPAGLARTVARSVYDIVTTSPTRIWSNPWIAATGMSATTRLPCSARTVSTRWK